MNPTKDPNPFLFKIDEVWYLMATKEEDAAAAMIRAFRMLKRSKHIMLAKDPTGSHPRPRLEKILTDVKFPSEEIC